MTGANTENVINLSAKYAQLAAQNENYGAQLYAAFLIVSRAALNAQRATAKEVVDFDEAAVLLDEVADEIHKALEFTHGNDYERIIDNLVGDCAVGELLDELVAKSQEFDDEQSVQQEADAHGDV